MTRVILDATTRAKLPGDLSEALEICDEFGRLLGHFTPVANSVEREFEMPPLSDEELQRRLKEPSFSTAEVLAHLQGRSRHVWARSEIGVGQVFQPDGSAIQISATRQAPLRDVSVAFNGFIAEVRTLT